MQTALAALCYFCENHGPRVVFTCQPIKTSELKLDGRERAVHSNSDGFFYYLTDLQFYWLVNMSNIIADLYTSSGGHHLCKDLYGGNEIVDDELRCEACSSFVQGNGLLSDISGREISYVSSQVVILYQNWVFG